MNNLFKDYKHNKDFLSLIHYKLGYKLYDIINHKNHPNLIISGINNSGKTLLIKTIMNGESRTAVRISEYESINTALSLAGKAAWIWVDFFKKFPLDKESYLKLKQANFKLCLVSRPFNK